MLFKEKLLLSNCDSVRKLDKGEVRKRFLTAMTFADGVVLSPNMLIDNPDMHDLLSQINIVKYLNEEGLGKLIVRGFDFQEGQSLGDYYEKLPPGFIISSLPKSPRKDEISRQQERDILQRIQAVQQALNNTKYKVESLARDPDALQKEVLERIDVDEVIGDYFKDKADRVAFLDASKQCRSRSEWYQMADDYFFEHVQNVSERFKFEIINPAYNSLFAIAGEGFLQDKIKYLNNVPEVILDSTVLFKALRREIELIEYPLKAFDLITGGTAGISSWVTDQALDYIQDKVTEEGGEYLTRKNWFGMYSRMTSHIGLEIK